MSNGNWMPDAALMSISVFDLEKYITKTSKVEEFIGSSQFIITAPKGYGKTLLLKYTYSKIIHDESNKNAIIIPSNTEIDSFENSIPFSSHFEAYLSEEGAWGKLWQISIGLSIILNYSMKTYDYEFIDEFSKCFKRNNCRLNEIVSLISSIKERIRDNISIPTFIKTQVNPSSILGRLLTSSVSNLRSSDNNALDCVYQWCLSVNRPVYVFIDQIDQGIRDKKLPIWESCQTGIVEAIFKLHNPNHQIKIYASIRLEAWRKYHGELQSQLLSIVCELEYSKDELKEIFEDAIIYYEKYRFLPSYSHKKIINTFVGIDNLENKWGNEEETLFDYMLRHSLRRPRDLMLLGRKIHELNNSGELTEREFTKLVNRIPSEEINNQYLSEVYRFTRSLKNLNMQRFLMHVNKNILTRKELIDICSSYNEDVPCLARETCNINACHSCKGVTHIFCDFYRTGLLGIVKTNELQNSEVIQSFNIPGKISTGHLPQSDYYLLHPAMDYYIKNIYGNNNFSPVRGVVIGKGHLWKKKYEQIFFLSEIQDITKTHPIRISPEFSEKYNALIASIIEELDNSEVDQKRKELQDIVISDSSIDNTTIVANILTILSNLGTLM